MGSCDKPIGKFYKDPGLVFTVWCKHSKEPRVIRQVDLCRGVCIRDGRKDGITAINVYISIVMSPAV